jgi:hypothetical protein
MTFNTQEEAVAAATPLEGENSKVSSLLSLTRETAALAGGFLELLLLELRLAIHAIPRIIGLTLISLVLALFVWLSFAFGIAWSCAFIFGSTGWGILAFFLLQLLALFVCMGLTRKYTRRLTLPNSRNFLRQLEEAFNGAGK